MELNKKSYKLAIYLLKEEIKNYSQALEPKLNYKEYDFNENIQVDGKVIVGKTKTNKPNWKDLLQQGITEQIPDISNASNRAVVFFKINNRIFAIPFGYGKHLIKDETIERDFGLKTALNIINADKLLSIDKANIGNLSVQTRTQTSKKGGPDSFDIDIIKDLLRSVTGEPNLVLPEEFGSVITGNEGIYISPNINMFQIPEILTKLEGEYKKDTYKERFDWIDNIRTEKDPFIIDNLRKKLITDLKAKDDESISLVPPYIIDWSIFEGISFTPKGDIFNDYNIEDFYNIKEDSLKDLDWDKLSKLRLYLKDSNQSDSIPTPLWRYINYETEYNGFRYAFTLSNWYRIDKSYFDEMYNYCKQFEESDLDFPYAKLMESEGKYNERFTKTNSDLILLDQKLVKSDIARSAIEVCDVFSNTKEFVHIKIRYSSATLSHLFSQGRISAYSLLKDRTYRKNLRSKINSEGLDKDLIPLESKDLRNSDFTITYALIEKKDRTFVDSLPFFSLVNFRLTSEELSVMGFNVKVKKIMRK